MGYDVGKEGNVAEEKRTEEISEIKQEPSVSPEDMRYMKEAMADKTVLAHAEILAMKKACKKMGDWRLEDCTMYVTLEPCPMCAGAIVQARIPRVVIGCMNPKAGCAGSVLDMLHEEGFNHQVQTDINVCREECSGMLSQFFKDLRKKRAEK